MNKLDRIINNSPLLRRIGYSDELLRGPVIAYCDRAEIDKAIKEFRKIYGRVPEMVASHNGGSVSIDPAMGITKIERTEIVDHPSAAIWVFGKKLRAKANWLGLSGRADLFFATEPGFRNSRYQPDLWHNHAAELQQVCDMLEDDESRRTLASLVKYRLRGDHGYMRIEPYQQYRHPLVRAERGDWIVDAGAFNGDTSLAFALQAPGGRVYGFEPDPLNWVKIANLLENARKCGEPERAAAADIVQVVPFALHSAVAALDFSSGASGSSRLTNTTLLPDETVPAADNVATPGTSKVMPVNAVSLDHFADEQGLPRLDLVSLDIEGAERAALLGMRKVVERYRPKLQISIYHKPKDIFELPLMLRDMCKGYAFFMGHHNCYSTETDLYCIPRERISRS